MNDRELESKALRIGDFVEAHGLQEHGMVPMFVRARDYALPTAEDYEGAYTHRHMHGKTEAEVGLPPMHVWRAWEDTASNTAYYLGALSYQYRCTGDSHVAQRCRRTLAAMKYIVDVGAEAIEPGFLCKPYGGRASNQTSSDQLCCAAAGLDAHRRIAGPEGAALIGKIFKSFADYLIRRDYYHEATYFGAKVKPKYRLRSGERRPGRDWEPGSLDWSIGLVWAAVMHHAWLDSGESLYLKEIEHIYAGCGLDRTPDAGGGRSSRHLYLPALMMELDPRHHDVWRSMMLNTFQNARESIEPDGTQRLPGFGGQGDPSQGFLGPHRTGRSAQWSLGMVTAQRWFPDEAFTETARRILEGLDMATFRFVMPETESGALPPQWVVEGEMIDFDSLAPWLFAYWLGRYRGYW